MILLREDVEYDMSTFPRNQTVIDSSLPPRDLRQEEVYVADEMGVQGRFEQAVGRMRNVLFMSVSSTHDLEATMFSRA